VRRAIGNPNVVISPSHFLIDAYRARGFFPNSRVCLLPNPAPNMEIPKRGDRGEGPIKLLFAGQLETHKGILFLLDALAGLDIPYELHIAGDGAFHGFVAFDKLLHLISVSDAVVVPSLCYENSPTIIYESFAAGVPVLASNMGGIPELIQEGENGFLFEPGTKDSFLRAFEKIAQDLHLWWDASDAIRVGAKKYHLNCYVDELEKIISR
jgi:glycosyltransferase involved in cell wall biosynthesis